EIEMISRAIEKSGRQIVLSLSPGPALIQEAWHYETYANMWRITDDFWDNWDLLKDMFHRCELWQDHVKPGCYPDCDMLPLGHIGHGFKDDRETNFTREEQRSMMTLWCLFGSPLMLGAEMTLLDDWTLSLLTNRKVLDMLTPWCRPHLLKSEEDCVIWTAWNEKTNSRYLALFNLKDQEDMISCDLNTAGEEFENSSLTELWTGEQAAFQNGKLACSLKAHGCKVFGCFTLP
ncbi:MAG: alpha-galactosidase, partial [Lachnospiraceae bacterium]|nr:alpha-galactosidase [Lachnospiraceae bacterium]